MDGNESQKARKDERLEDLFEAEDGDVRIKVGLFDRACRVKVSDLDSST